MFCWLVEIIWNSVHAFDFPQTVKFVWIVWDADCARSLSKNATIAAILTATLCDIGTNWIVVHIANLSHPKTFDLIVISLATIGMNKSQIKKCCQFHFCDCMYVSLSSYSDDFIPSTIHPYKWSAVAPLSVYVRLFLVLSSPPPKIIIRVREQKSTNTRKRINLHRGQEWSLIVFNPLIKYSTDLLFSVKLKSALFLRFPIDRV